MRSLQIEGILRGVSRKSFGFGDEAAPEQGIHIVHQLEPDAQNECGRNIPSMPSI